MALPVLGQDARNTIFAPAANAGSVGGRKSAEIFGKLPTGGIASDRWLCQIRSYR